MRKHDIEPAVFSIEQLMQYTGLGKDRAKKFGYAAGAVIRLSEKRRGYLKSKIDEELEKRLEETA